MPDRERPAAYINVRLRAETARELLAAAPSRHVLTTGAQRELLDCLRDGLRTPAFPTDDEPNDVAIAEISLGSSTYFWAVRSSYGVVKVWSTRDSCMLAVNPERARIIGKAFSSAMEAAALATDRASRGEPRTYDAPEVSS